MRAVPPLSLVIFNGTIGKLHLRHAANSIKIIIIKSPGVEGVVNDEFKDHVEHLLGPDCVPWDGYPAQVKPCEKRERKR